MVKSKGKQNGKKTQASKSAGEIINEKAERTPSINANTPYGECSERMTAFGGLLALIKMLDLVKFRETFDEHFLAPKREPKLGHYRMMLGILMLLFIGFQRLGHFAYIQSDPLLCGILQVTVLPAVSTFWRYLQSLGIFQSQSLLRLSAALRKLVWERMSYRPTYVSINIDTTVATVYGRVEGARKGHNTKHRGKKGLRPVLCFIDQTREYLCGTQRRGETIENREVAWHIMHFRRLLPDFVKRILVRGDGEFIGWKSVKACKDDAIDYIFGNKKCDPPFPEDGWYRHGEHEYNECEYQPLGWDKPCRFVAMRIRNDKRGDRQLRLIEEFMYRVFVTSLKSRPHRVIEEYDDRANVENLIGEAQREGLLAIPSNKFQAHHAFFQIVMLSYNLWRWMQLLAGHAQQQAQSEHDPSTDEAHVVDHLPAITMPDATIRIARLKMLFVAAKILFHANRDQVMYSMHEQRAAGIIDLLEYLDEQRAQKSAA